MHCLCTSYVLAVAQGALHCTHFPCVSGYTSMKPQEFKEVDTGAKRRARARCCSCSVWASKYLPHINFLDPNAPYINWAHCNMEKSFLFSVDPKTTVCGFVPSCACKPFLIAANVWMTPWLLGLHFINIYIVPAFTSIAVKIVEKFICALNIFSCGFTDCYFPPNDRSIGSVEIKSHTIKNLDCWHRGLVYLFTSPCYDCCVTNEVEWARAADLKVHHDNADNDIESNVRDADTMKLFEGRIEPADIMQGSLGDCWLLAALACIAERNEALIKTLFLTRTASECGHYKVRLYDVFNGPPAWRCFTLDDWVPVDKGTSNPMYTKPNGNELWVMLMEKAFAKMVGSYKALSGGKSRMPFRAMTGNTPIAFRIEGYGKDTKILAGDNTGVKNVPPDLHYQEAWHVFQGALQHNMISCAECWMDDPDKEKGNCSLSGVDNATGLVSGHMYSILDTCVTKSLDGTEVKLIQMRNPWGKHEWSGTYSEHDVATKGWKPHGGFLIGSLFSSRQAVKDDGIFWMPFNDFLQHFRLFTLCAVSQNMSSLHLDMCEQYGVCGPLGGVVDGAVQYCCMCKGASHLWCPNNASTLDMIMSFKNGSAVERIERCCEVTARAAVHAISPDSRFGKADPDAGDLF